MVCITHSSESEELAPYLLARHLTRRWLLGLVHNELLRNDHRRTAGFTVVVNCLSA